MTTAMSHLSGVLLGEEVTWGTAVPRGLALAANSESLQLDEGFHVSGAMRSDPTEQVAVSGLRGVSGGLNLEPNANDLGRLLRGLFASRDSAPLEGRVAQAPNLQRLPGGNLTQDATYRYKVSAVVTEADGSLRALEPSPEATLDVTATDKTLDVSWSAPASLPDRTTLAGYVIWRTAANGAEGTEKWLRWSAGAGTGYTDAGGDILDTKVDPPPVVYRHRAFRGTGDLASFSVEVLKNNGFSELVTGAMFNGANFSIQSDGPMGFDLDLLARNIEKVSSSVPAFGLSAKPFMGHRTMVWFQDQGGMDVAFTLATQLSLSIQNNLNGRRWLNNSQLLSAIKPGRQVVTGQFMLELENMNTFADVVNHATKAIRTVTWANAVASWEKTLGTGEVIRPWAYQVGLHLPAIKLLTHQASSSGQDPIVQTVGLHCLKDATAGYPVQVEVHNLTPSYS